MSDFRPEDYRRDVQDKVSPAGTPDLNFPVIQSVKSYWNYVNDNAQYLDALLICEADITLVNPDRASAISVINVQIDAQIHFTRTTTDIHQGYFLVVAFPHEDTVLDSHGEGPFRILIDQQIPNAYHITRKSDFSYPARSLCESHKRALVELEAPIAQWGLPVVKVDGNRNSYPALQQLRNAPALSADARTREALYAVIRQILHVRPLGLSAAPGGQRTLSAGGAELIP
jgi:hypothetical protein